MSQRPLIVGEPVVEEAVWTASCLSCGEQFAAGDWLCSNGQKHVLTEKTYLLNDAPAQFPRDEAGKPLPKTGRTIITNIPPGVPASAVPPGSDDPMYGGGTVTFYDGRYQTTDPLEQFYLDQRRGYCTEAEWEAAWLTPAEQKKKELEREQSEIEQRARRVADLEKDVSRLRAGRKG